MKSRYIGLPRFPPNQIECNILNPLYNRLFYNLQSLTAGTKQTSINLSTFAKVRRQDFASSCRKFKRTHPSYVFDNVQLCTHGVHMFVFQLVHKSPISEFDAPQAGHRCHDHQACAFADGSNSNDLHDLHTSNIPKSWKKIININILINK